MVADQLVGGIATGALDVHIVLSAVCWDPLAFFLSVNGEPLGAGFANSLFHSAAFPHDGLAYPIFLILLIGAGVA